MSLTREPRRNRFKTAFRPSLAAQYLRRDCLLLGTPGRGECVPAPPRAGSCFLQKSLERRPEIAAWRERLRHRRAQLPSASRCPVWQPLVPLLVDENFNHRILRGLKRRLPALDTLLVQEANIVQYDDLNVLAWAAAHSRVVITHDVNTMTRYAYTRLEVGQPVPGVVIVPKTWQLAVLSKTLSSC